MRYRVLGVCLLALISACFGVQGNGHRVTETRRVRAASQIENDSPFDVDISQGDSFEVRVSIDSNLQRVVETRVSGAMLIIHTDAWLTDIPSGPHVFITMPRIDKLENNGSGSVFAAWFEQDDDVRVRLAGSGDLSFEGAVARIAADLQGSGDMHLSGSADFAALTIDGSGDIDGNDLVAAQADLKVDGSGDLRVSVDGRVDARVDGSGDVDISGDAQRGTFAETGSGRIQVHGR